MSKSKFERTVVDLNVVDYVNGKPLKNMSGDDILVALHDSTLRAPDDHIFVNVPRSDLTVHQINRRFGCNAALLKDQFGNVLWPKDWKLKTLPPEGNAMWFYFIHERAEPTPRDDLKDVMYMGPTVIVLSFVPIAAEVLDLQTWLLFGIAQDFSPLVAIIKEIDAIKLKMEKLITLTAKQSKIELDSDEQAAEIRQKGLEAAKNRIHEYDVDINRLIKKKKRIQHLLMTEPIEIKPNDEQKLNFTDGDDYPNHTHVFSETRDWTINFTSSRGTQLMTIALEKRDWNYICLLATRPKPRAYFEDDLVSGKIEFSESELACEINMRTVRLTRLRHGQGDKMEAKLAKTIHQAKRENLTVDQIPSKYQGREITNTDDMQLPYGGQHRVGSEKKPKKIVVEPLGPCDEGFHVSSIGSMYSGGWHLGKKHGKGVEYTNSGVYRGEFTQNIRSGFATLVYGKGTKVCGMFRQPCRKFLYSKICKDKSYYPSILTPDLYQDGVEMDQVMSIEFPDGATYTGEMKDGKISGLGKYVSSTGVIDEGTFLDGALNGFNCRRTFPNGRILEGEFKNGELHGLGHEVSKYGDDYTGYFSLGIKEGRGVALFSSNYRPTSTSQHKGVALGGNRYIGRYSGFWKDNIMDGRGQLHYIDHLEINNTANEKDLLHNELHVGDNQHWDYLYEGAFVAGQTRSQHRHLKLHPNAQYHFPFTTNNKSILKMPYLTNDLPIQVRKQSDRSRKNWQRLLRRQSEYLWKKEFENLTLYYRLLDEFYEKWAQSKREIKEEIGLSQAQVTALREKRTAVLKYEADRLKRRQEVYDLSPRYKDLMSFEKYLERVTLTEYTQLQGAVNEQFIPGESSFNDRVNLIPKH